MAAVPDNAQSSGTPATATVEKLPNPKPCYLSKLFPPPTTVYNTMVEVIVGKASLRSFQAHKGLLGHFSEYFKRAFGNPQWQEPQDRVVRLNDDDPETFQLFYNWIYTGNIRDDTSATPHIEYHTEDIRKKPIKFATDEVAYSGDPTREDAVPVTFRQLFRLAAFANMRMVPALADTAATLTMQKLMTEQILPIKPLQDLEELLPNSQILCMLITVIVPMAADAEFDKHEENFPLQMIKDLPSALRVYLKCYPRGNQDDENRYCLDLLSCIWHPSCRGALMESK